MINLNLNVDGIMKTVTKSIWLLHNATFKIAAINFLRLLRWNDKMDISEIRISDDL